MQSLLASAVRNKPVDYVEVRVEETQITRLEYRNKDIETLGLSTSFGGNVRALFRGGWGFTSFNSLDDLSSKVDAAITLARLIGGPRDEVSRLAPVPIVKDRVKLAAKTDPRDVSLEAKKRVLDTYNQIVLSHGNGVSGSSIRYLDTYTRLHFASSEGSYIDQEKIDISGTVTAIATRGAQTEMGRVTFGSTDDWNVVCGLEAKVREGCEIASGLLDAPSVQGGVYTVILDPVLAGIFAHEAFGHLSEADSVYENPNLQEVMVLGRRFGEDALSIYDTGLDRGSRGHLVCDDEGVKAEKTYLIKDGVLCGRLHSRETAGKMGEKPTGNARAISYKHPPIVRMRNTAIERGDASFEDMLKGVKLGVYAVESYGGQTNGEMFTFSAGQAYMIRNGQIAELVRDVNLTGNVFETLKNIDMVGADFRAQEAAGGCGKGAQSPLPTSQWAPHIRVQNVVVGGRR